MNCNREHSGTIEKLLQRTKMDNVRQLGVVGHGRVRGGLWQEKKCVFHSAHCTLGSTTMFNRSNFTLIIPSFEYKVAISNTTTECVQMQKAVIFTVYSDARIRFLVCFCPFLWLLVGSL